MASRNLCKGCSQRIWCSGVVSNWRARNPLRKQTVLESWKKMCVQWGKRHEQCTLLHKTATHHYSTCGPPSAPRAATGRESTKAERCRRAHPANGAARPQRARRRRVCLHTLESTDVFLKVSIIFPTAWVPWLGVPGLSRLGSPA